MNRKLSTSSAGLEKKTTILTEIDMLEPKLAKKLQPSSPTELQESTSIDLKNASGKENYKLFQEKILQEIENANIQVFIKEQMAKFEPPFCEKCSEKKADRVCVNKKCGNNYMQLICEKCHFEVHKDAKTKPEIDIQEYFVKLATFLNSQQYKKKKSQAHIDTENLSSIFNIIQEIHEKLNNLKSKLMNQPQGDQPPSEIHSVLGDCITKVLTKCEVGTIQKQLNIIKLRLLFQNNQFVQNDVPKKYETFSKMIDELENYADSMYKITAKSFIEGSPIDLSELKCQNSISLCSFGYGGPSSLQIKSNSSEITLTNGPGCIAQVYLDYLLDLNKKYKFRFRFDFQPTRYVMVGVMPYSMAQSKYVYAIEGQYFSKRFLDNRPIYECSRIIRGQDLSNFPKKDTEIEMRIDFAENYVDFVDYPNYENINASFPNNKFLSKEPYVLAFTFCQMNQITLIRLEEISQIQQY